MSKKAESASGLLDAESSLGQALAVIHRLLPRLDQSAAFQDVQDSFKRLAGYIEAAREAHKALAPAQPTVTAAAGGIPGETVAAIAAAVAAVLGQSFKLVSVAKVPVPVPHINVWALEGRTQIFQSHQIR